MSERLYVSIPCAECGGSSSFPLYNGTVVGRYCLTCREAQAKAFEDDRLERQAASLAYQRQVWLSDPQRGIPYRYADLTWDDFKYDRGGEANRHPVAKIRRYAEGFPVDSVPKGAKSLLIASENNGCGKTMLATLLLRSIVDRYTDWARERCPYQFWTTTNIKLRLRSAERFGSQENPEDVYRDFTTMWLLVMDDVGKEQLAGAEAAYAYEMYFTIINARYNAGLPVVVTSNLNVTPWRHDGGPDLLDLMGRGSVSRLVEMTEGQVYVISGEDRR